MPSEPQQLVFRVVPMSCCADQGMWHHPGWAARSVLQSGGSLWGSRAHLLTVLFGAAGHKVHCTSSSDFAVSPTWVYRARLTAKKRLQKEARKTLGLVLHVVNLLWWMKTTLQSRWTEDLYSNIRWVQWWKVFIFKEILTVQIFLRLLLYNWLLSAPVEGWSLIYWNTWNISDSMDYHYYYYYYYFGHLYNMQLLLGNFRKPWSFNSVHCINILLNLRLGKRMLLKIALSSL